MCPILDQHLRKEQTSQARGHKQGQILPMQTKDLTARFRTCPEEPKASLSPKRPSSPSSPSWEPWQVRGAFRSDGRRERSWRRLRQPDNSWLGVATGNRPTRGRATQQRSPGPPTTSSPHAAATCRAPKTHISRMTQKERSFLCTGRGPPAVWS